ncbi:hypothetical protein ANN_11993, partial [Periplaneta americana]
RPVQQTVCGAVLRDSNWKCLILTLLIYGCLGAVTWCRLTEVSKVIINFSGYPITNKVQMSPCDKGYVYIPIAFMLMLYLVYLVECWHCTAREELNAKVHVASVMETVRLMREAQPIVWWKALCYHYVRRKRQVVRTRHGGDSYTTTQVYYERVNAHAAGSCFLFAYCGVRDISRDLSLEGGPITKIRFSKGFAFANVEAAAEFEDQRARFFAEHERYDDYMEMREGLDLTGISNFKEHVVAYADLPWYSNRMVFWVCSCLLLSWPIRILLEYNTAHVHYQVTKLFGVNYTTPSSTVVQMSTGSTMDSAEWSQALVPSYSEAVLMDAIPDNNNTVVASASQMLFYPGPLADCVPADPFPPPEYEEALRLPALTRLRRSLTDRGEDMFRRSREQRRASGIVVRVNMETSL